MENENKKISIGKIEDRSIVTEMEQSYLDYAMSVIVSRALPDVRDGLKPVHRRILYAMWDIGLKAGAKFRKSATVVGEVLGKYHPHGDAAVYESMVRMAQDFSMREPLVNGQGNFGSLDGDGAAAMRYTEAKLQQIAEEMLYDIDKNTVNFIPNYDGSHQEPQVLPAKLPNLLLNGTSGIAVGMATSIPPHNLTELIDALIYMIDNPDCLVDDLLQFIKGPDFPTGGIIFDVNEIKQTYVTGKGKIVMRAKTEIVEEKTGQFRIIVTEIPYQVNKATLLEKVADLVRDKKVDGIKDIRDESDRDGVRIVIDLKKDAYPKKVLNRLFKLTSLQEAFHVNMLALVDGIQPKVLYLKEILKYFVKHRQEVVKKRAEFDLEKAMQRAHVLEGLVVAIDNIDEVIKIIKKSQDRDEAKGKLMTKFKLSEIQANAILDMRLSQLANLERLKIEEELAEKKKIIAELEALLASEKKMLNVIQTELLEIKEKYGTERRTKVMKGPVGEFSQEDLIPNEPTIVTITRDGYIKRLPTDTFKTQARGGKGVIGLATKEEDIVEHFFTTETHADILFFTTTGRVFQLKAYEIPQGTRISKGQNIVNFLQLAPNEKISSVLQLSHLEQYKYLVLTTKQGLIKKVDIKDFAQVRRSGLIAIKIKDKDQLRWVMPSNGDSQILLTTTKGQAIRFKEKDVRPMGRSAAGVRGIRVRTNDELIGMGVINAEEIKTSQLLVISEVGFGKRSDLNLYKIQNRGGSGVKTAKLGVKTGILVFGKVVDKTKIEGKDIIIISEQGQVIRMPVSSINNLGRDTQGVRLMKFKEPKDRVASATIL